jgi:carboxyl-terminal processing protease
LKPGKASIYLPIAFALVLIAGIWIGKSASRGNSGYGKRNARFSGGDKINSIIDYVQDQYVDTVNKEKLVDKTIADMLQSLDPHSAYMTAEERKRMNEPLEGNFEGIGIEFNIVADTIRVMNVITAGPSANAGIEPGDRIVRVDDKVFTGKIVTNALVLKTLRGKGGSKVKLSIRRQGVAKLLDIPIVRGTVPIYSIDAAYMLKDHIGYIKLSRFAATSYDEYMKAYNTLRAQGMQKMILDVRGNGGGYLNIAVSLADEFLAKGKLIVYTKGRSVNRGGKKYVATSTGDFENAPLILLIDENSASASEIIAGAIQDNDRGLIVGRRSFGKGLVQEEKDLPDSSAFRLTIARYYTPSGRCIQRSYSKGTEEYYQEENDRFKRGELLNADSIKFADSLKFKTPKGKTVYGGGGIMPDVFVPLDTAERNHYVNALIFKGLIRDFALEYADGSRDQLRKGGFEHYRQTFVVTDQMLAVLVSYGAKLGIKPEPAQLASCRDFLANYIKATLARVLWDEQSFYVIFNSRDKTLQRAVSEAEKEK